MPQRERGRTPAGFRAQLLQRLRNEALQAGIPVQPVWPVISAAFLISFPDYFRLSQSAMLEIPLTVYMTLSLLFRRANIPVGE